MIYRSKTAQPPAPAENDAGRILTLANPDGWGLSGTISEDSAMKLSAVYACVTYLCDFVSALPIYVWDGDRRQRVKGHPLNSLLNVRPNEFQSPSTFMRYLFSSAIFRGTGYAYISRNPSSAKPVELLPLSSDHMLSWLDGNKPRYLYTMPKTGEQFRFDAQDILHITFDVGDGFNGKGIMKHASQTLSRATSADEYEAAVYRNHSKPGGILHTDNDLGGPSAALDKDGNPISKKENIRRAWERAHSGDNAFRVAILDNGLKYEPIKIDAYDASFIAAKDVSVADIARFFGVPLHALGAGKQSYSSNEQNSMEFIQGRGLAIIRAFEEEYSYKLLLDSELDRNMRIKFNLDGRMRGDTAARAAFYGKMREIGAYSVNDILALEDKPDVPGGDVHYASLNFVPLELFEMLSKLRNEQKQLSDSE